MIFKEIDFHIEQYEKTPSLSTKDMRLRMNHIIDAIFLKMPKKVKTDSIKKLNCYACAIVPKNDFIDCEGICMAYVYYPDAYSIPEYKDEKLISTVKMIIKEGLKIAVKHDGTLENYLPELYGLVDSSGEPFEYKTGVKRSHRSRKFKCEGIIKIQQNKYTSEILITSKAGEAERYHVKDLKPLLYKPDLGFNKLRWEGDKVVGYKGDSQEFTFKPKMISN